MPWGTTNLYVKSPTSVGFDTVHVPSRYDDLFSLPHGTNKRDRNEHEPANSIYDSPISQKSTRTLIVRRSGDYFVSWTLPLRMRPNKNRKRSALRSMIYVNGTRRKVGVGESSYIRNSNRHTESSCHLHTLLTDLSKGDRIHVRIVATAGEKVKNVFPDGQFSLYAERVPDTENVFSATARRTTRGKNLNQKAANLEWNARRVDEGFSHASNEHPEEISLKAIGDYLVFVNIPLKSSGSRRMNVKGSILLDGNRVDGGLFQQGYIRNDSGHRHASIHFAGWIRSTETDQTLTVRVQKEAESGTVTTGGRNATILIRPLPDQGVYAARGAKLTGENPNNWNPKQPEKIRWGVVRQIDDEVYDQIEDTASPTITVKQDGDYFLAINTALTNSGSRTNPELRVLVNGSPVPWATVQTHYIRKTDNHSDSSGAGAFLLPDLSKGDVISVDVQREASGGTVDDQAKALLTIWKKS